MIKLDQARRCAKHMSRKYHIRHGECLDILANYIGFKRWQHLVRAVDVGEFTNMPLLRLEDGQARCWLALCYKNNLPDTFAELYDILLKARRNLIF